MAVALDYFLLTSLHRRLLRWCIGSSGAERLATAHLTSSLDNSTLIAPMLVSDPSVKPVTLDQIRSCCTLLFLLTYCNDAMLRCTVGSTGAEDLTSAGLTSSLDNSMVIALMPIFDPPVKLVLLKFPHLAQYARPNAPMQGRQCIRQPSDAPMVRHRFNRCS